MNRHWTSYHASPDTAKRLAQILANLARQERNVLLSLGEFGGVYRVGLVPDLDEVVITTVMPEVIQ